MGSEMCIRDSGDCDAELGRCGRSGWWRDLCRVDRAAGDGLAGVTVALLISVEPLIDMGRTALNVSGSMTAGAITSQIMQQTDKELLGADEHSELVHA